MGYGGIDFNPQPMGGNPLDLLTQGANLGLGLQRGALAQQESARQEQELQMRKDAEEQARAEKGIAALTDPKITNNISDATYGKILKDAVIPRLNKTYGFDINPNDIEMDEGLREATGKILKLVQAGASKDIIKNEYQQVLLNMSGRKSKDELPILKEFGDTLGISGTAGGQTKQVPGRVTDKGLPVMFDSSIQEYMYRDPQSGELATYRGELFPAQANPSSGSEAKLAEIKQQRSLVDESLAMLTPDKVGNLDRAYNTIGAYMDQSTDPEATYFKSITEMANTIIRNNYYGATLTGNEKAAFQDIALNRALSPSAFRAKVKALQFSFNKMEGGIRDAAAASNRPFQDGGGSASKATSGSEDFSKMSDEELAAIAAGK